jgi:hypothetical protein
MFILIKIRRNDTVSSFAMRQQHWVLCVPVPQHLIRYIVGSTSKKQIHGHAEGENQVTDSLIFLPLSSDIQRCGRYICDNISCSRLTCISCEEPEIHRPHHFSYSEYRFVI